MILLKPACLKSLRQDSPDVVQVRAALQQAVELEHATLPVYLYGLYSLQSGVNTAIADIIQSVAMEEMLHMTLAANVLNALGALAAGRFLGFDLTKLARGLSEFRGVGRRLDRLGNAGGIEFVDDYGHHPTEIAATLQAARSVTKGNVIAVVQPHRFTRVRDLFEDFCKCFNDADKVIVTDIYTAGEEPIEGIDKDHLVEGIKKHGHKNVVGLPSEDALASLIAESAKIGDIVVCLGAGSITYMAAKLEGQLKAEKCA